MRRSFYSTFLTTSTAATIVLAVDPQTTTWSKRAPTVADWTSLNSTVGGRLYPGVPWPKPCFSSYKGKSVQSDAAQCGYVEQNHFNSHLPRSDAFGGYTAINYEGCMSTGDQCILNWMNPPDPTAFSSPQDCKQGSISDYYIDVSQASDVSAAFQFVKAKGIPLVVKNSGHDFSGRASGPGSLALWVHHLKSITHVPKFVPEGCSCSGTNALTIGTGTQFAQVYQFASDNNLLFVGGADVAVAATGGWGQGGGHSPISRLYGMGVDRTLQYKVVTPDGVLRTANRCQNSDLFWALRGGGGSTFGVVLEGTMEVFADRPFQMANVNWPASTNNTKQVLSAFLDSATALANQGWGGYLTPPNGNLILLTAGLSTTQKAQTSVKAINDVVTSLGGSVNVQRIPGFLTWFNGYVQGIYGAQDVVGLPMSLGSRLIPQKNHATAASKAALLDATMDAINNSFFQQIHFTTPYVYTGTKAEDTSVNPVWRSSLWQIITVNTWPYDASLDIKKAQYASTTQALASLRKITPDGGAYHNEADIHEPNFQTSFWGSNYARLLSIKNKYDPNHLLDCWNCVGWTGQASSRFKCYI